MEDDPVPTRGPGGECVRPEPSEGPPGRTRNGRRVGWETGVKRRSLSSADRVRTQVAGVGQAYCRDPKHLV